jgi:DNA methylase
VKLDRQQAAQLELDVVSSLWLPKGIATPTHGGARSKGLRAADKPGRSQLSVTEIPETHLLKNSVIFEGDALAVLRRLPSQSVQCIVTSPPYWGLRDYHIPCQIGLEPTLPEFLASLRAIFAEARRALRDDGVFWLNIGDGYTSGNRGWRAADKKVWSGTGAPV